MGSGVQLSLRGGAYAWGLHSSSQVRDSTSLGGELLLASRQNWVFQA